MFTPRPYQTEAVDRLFETFETHRSGLIVAATGVGKTVIMSLASRRWLQESHGRVLGLVHREELAFQFKEKLQDIASDATELEMGEFRANHDSMLVGHADCVVASVQSLYRDSRLRRYNPHDFGLLFIDEAHHATPKCKTYQTIIRHFSQNLDLKICGVTATPDRADEESLGQTFDAVAFQYDLPDAIRDGYLLPVRQKLIMVEDLDFSSVRTTAGDLNAGDLDRIMSEEKMLHRVVSPTIDIAGDRPTLVFAPSVDSAQKMAEVFNRHKLGSAVCIHGETDSDERRYELARFSRGEFTVLVNCGIFLEGFDSPRISVVAMARPTKSRSLYAQCAGRATRPLPGIVDGLETAYERRSAIARSAKPDCLVIDFVGNSGRHKLVTTADILSGKETDEVVERAKQRAEAASAKGADTDTLAELEAAQHEVDERKRRQRLDIIAKARFAARDIDPFDLFDISVQREPGYLKGKPPTDKQLAWLRHHARGVNLSGISLHKASQLIDSLKKRQDTDMCTPQQAALLARYGRPANVSQAEARELIQEINVSLKLQKV